MGRCRVCAYRTRSRHPCTLLFCSRQMTALMTHTRHLPDGLAWSHSSYSSRLWRSAFLGGFGDLLAGQSGCREQPISAQGWLERVLRAGPRARPLALHKLRTWQPPTVVQASKTVLPPTIVFRTGIFLISSTAVSLGSPARITRSASLPGVILPLMFSSIEA